MDSRLPCGGASKRRNGRLTFSSLQAACPLAADPVDRLSALLDEHVAGQHLATRAIRKVLEPSTTHAHPAGLGGSAPSSASSLRCAVARSEAPLPSALTTTAERQGGGTNSNEGRESLLNLLRRTVNLSHPGGFKTKDPRDLRDLTIRDVKPVSDEGNDE